MVTTTDTDRIEKKIALRAPRSRVWRALSDPREFGTWFGVELTGAFAPGALIRGRITIEEYKDLVFEMVIDRMEPERLFSYRWHPYAVDPKKDYSREPMTLVVFELESTTEGTMLTVVESGFDQIPPERRKEAYRMNEGGWAEQVKNIERHVTQA
jgi:uncharacterized protein YndB with AHSA1/START domain